MTIEYSGDLLFAEACLARGVHLQIRIPFDEPTFLRNSVTFAGGNWGERYYAVKNNKLTTLLVMPEELGPTPEKAHPYERNNLWQLYTALSMGPEKVRFICLWEREGGRWAWRDQAHARFGEKTFWLSLRTRY